MAPRPQIPELGPGPSPSGLSPGRIFPEEVRRRKYANTTENPGLWCFTEALCAALCAADCGMRTVKQEPFVF